MAKREYACRHMRWIASRWCREYTITHKRCKPNVAHFEQKWVVLPKDHNYDTQTLTPLSLEMSTVGSVRAGKGEQSHGNIWFDATRAKCIKQQPPKQRRHHDHLHKWNDFMTNLHKLSPALLLQQFLKSQQPQSHGWPWVIQFDLSVLSTWTSTHLLKKLLGRLFVTDSISFTFLGGIKNAFSTSFSLGLGRGGGKFVLLLRSFAKVLFLVLGEKLSFLFFFFCSSGTAICHRHNTPFHFFFYSFCLILVFVSVISELLCSSTLGWLFAFFCLFDFW